MVFETTKCLHERRVAAESSISACAQAKLARQDDGIKVDPAAVVGEQRDPAQEQDCRRSDEWCVDQLDIRVIEREYAQSRYGAPSRRSAATRLSDHR